MAFDLSALNDYVNETGSELQYKVILGANTLQKGLVTVQPNVKSAINLNILDSTLEVVEGFCGFSPSDTTVIDKVTLEVTEHQIDRGFCLKDLEKKWAQIAYQAGSYQESLEEIFVGEQNAKVAEIIEKQIWQGDASGTGNLGIADGLLVKIADAGTASGVISITGSSFTTSNAIARMDEYIDAMDEALLDVETYAYLSPKQFQTYVNAAIDANLYHINPVTDYYETGIRHRGSKVTVFPVKGLSGSTDIIITYKENLFVGLDLESDPTNFVGWFEQKDKKYYISIQYKLGTAVLFPPHVVSVKMA
jgi:hypothetical protein